jgi:hypothetical protein
MKRYLLPALLLALGWVVLLAATNLALLASIQAIGVGLGLLITVRIVQSWKL